MPSASLASVQPTQFSLEPDLHPLYPTAAHTAVLLSSHSGLDPAQKAELVSHSLTRACVFGELSVIQYLLADPQAQAHVDLTIRDEDGLGLIGLTIHGFGAESDRDIEREECVRLLVQQGADLGPDIDGWTPLHHAALLAPPTLISFLMTHGCSPFSVTRRNLTPLDIVTAHSTLPGHDAVALLLEEAMRSEGWTGGRMEQSRRQTRARLSRKRRQNELRHHIGRALDIAPIWWGGDSDIFESDGSGSDEDSQNTEYTPPFDYSTMLVFSPPELPHIFESLITNYSPKFRDANPANTLYMLARFAGLTCDHTWLEDLIIGAADTIEATFFNHADELPYLIFWLYNSTVLLHLLQCDNSINEACEMLGSFELIEEIINSVFVFIIRFAEKRIDPLVEQCILDYVPPGLSQTNIRFEAEWSIFRPFGSMRKSQSPATVATLRHSPPSPSRPLSPQSPKSTSSLKQPHSRAYASAAPLHAILQESNSHPTLTSLTSFLSALHTFLTISDINPAMTTQLWSQVTYWTACEMFNRMLTRKQYLCRSKAVQMSANLSTYEDWMDRMNLPRGIHSHLQPVKDLLNWLQHLSSITDFPDLVATIQTMKSINPLQMRRAVRDYRYEVNETKMTDECIQYLTQLQKDWERHRLKVGVEALRKELTDREREREEVSTTLDDELLTNSKPTFAKNRDEPPLQQSIDLLFDPFDADAALSWEPIRPPQVLGELLDSRYMLPLLFPSDPRKLAAVPGDVNLVAENAPRNRNSMVSDTSSQTSTARPVVKWRSKNRRIRELDIATLHALDRGRTTIRWNRTLTDYNDASESNENEGGLSESLANSHQSNGEEGNVAIHFTPLTRKPSARLKRPSTGEVLD